MKTLLLATKNSGKIAELLDLLKDVPIHCISPEDIGLDLEVPEIGSSYRENAAIKARRYAQKSGILSLADDSGLEVDALNGKPGIYSARYTHKKQVTDTERRKYLLNRLKNYPQPWTAYFRSAVCVVDPGGKEIFSDGSCAGIVIPEERGNWGFGYDPIFYFPQWEKTMAELDIVKKNTISHRSAAIANIRSALLRLIDEDNPGN